MHKTKKLGFWMCTALVVGNTIGMGIYMLPASMAPLGINSMWGWLITVAGCLFIAAVFSFMARQMPKAEGPYAYIRLNLGNFPAFIASWCYWVSMWVTLPALAVGVVAYLNASFPELSLPAPPLVAIALIWLFVAINMRGVVAGGAVQVVTTLLKLLPLAIVILVGCWVFITQPALQAVSLAPAPISTENLMSAATLALFAMLGIESATIPAENVDCPERTIPRATYAGTLIVAAVYLSVIAVVMLLIPYSQLEHSQAPLVDMLKKYLGANVGRWLGIFVIISGLGALNGWTMLVGQMTQTMAKNATMPAFFGHNNAHGAPVKSLVLAGVLASLLVGMNFSSSLVDIFTFLSLVVTAGNLPIYLLTAIALLKMQNRSSIANFTLFACIALLAIAYVVFAFLGVGLKATLWSLVLAAAGLPVYFLVQRQHRAASINRVEQ